MLAPILLSFVKTVKTLISCKPRKNFPKAFNGVNFNIRLLRCLEVSSVEPLAKTMLHCLIHLELR